MSAELATSILIDAFTRVHEELPQKLHGLPVGALMWRPETKANPIGWLAWHLARVQDDHLADLGGRDQVWDSQGFADRFGLAYPKGAIGYGQTTAEVGQFVIEDPALLTDYHAAVYEMTADIVTPMSGQDYARIVDTRWDPPVTAAARLVSVVNDTTQHLGQIAYLRGLWEQR